MKKVPHKKGWNLGTNPAHVEPLPISLIKETCNSKSGEDFVKLKLRRYPTSSTSDLYKFKMYLFEHGEPDEFLLFIRNPNMNLVVTGTLEMDA